MTIVGCDYNTKAIDLVVLDETTDRAKWHRFELDFLPGTDAFDRARHVRAVMPGASFWDDVLAVGIEDPRGYGAGSLYRVQGAILSCIPADKLVQPWIPSAWRKAVGQPGNAPKQAAVALVRHRLAGDNPFWNWPSDACDAYCIALATRSLVQDVAA